METALADKLEEQLDGGNTEPATSTVAEDWDTAAGNRWNMAVNVGARMRQAFGIEAIELRIVSQVFEDDGAFKEACTLFIRGANGQALPAHAAVIAQKAAESTDGRTFIGNNEIRVTWALACD